MILLILLILSILFMSAGVILFILSKFSADDRLNSVGNLVIVEEPEEAPYIFLEIEHEEALRYSRFIKLKVVRKKCSSFNGSKHKTKKGETL